MFGFFIKRFISVLVGVYLAITSPLMLAAPLHFGAPHKWLDLPFPTDVGSFPAFGDVNGDGKADLITYNPSRGTAHVALSNGQAFGIPKLWASGLPTATTVELSPWIATADVDGDRKSDLILFQHGDGQTDGSANVYVALSNGANFKYTSQPVWNDGFCITEQICKVADLNGDGKADIVAFTPITGLVWASLSEGNHFGTNAVWNNFFCIRGENCEVGDVDGDRKSDILLFKPHAVGVQKGNVLISPSNGSKFGAVRYGHGYFCIDNERCLVSDLNSDSKADVLLVKGMSADVHQPAEVLVSLSNGDKFINANPFNWGNLVRSTDTSGWGTFYVADVTGDGRGDLILTETISNNHGSTTGSRFLVYSTTDQAQAPVSGQPGSQEPPVGGVRQVNFFNCDPDQHRLYYWITDITAGTTNSDGPIDAMYSESGDCPDHNDAPFTINLTDGHIIDVVAVDSEQIGCDGRNDPTILGCIEQNFSFKGNAKGGVLNIIIPAIQPIRSLSIKSATPQDTIQSLGAARIDFSVKEADLRQWLSNSNTPYPELANHLLEILDGKRLKQPVYIDVIAWNYAHPKSEAHNINTSIFNSSLLKKAVLEGFNSRHGTDYAEFNELIEK